MKSLAIALFTAFMCSLAFAQLPYSGLIAFYGFNDYSDASGNSHHATNNGASLTTDRFGNASKAVAFDGTSSYISTFNPTPINDISISLWFKKSNNGVLYSSGDANNTIFNLYFTPSGQLEYIVSRSTGNSLGGSTSTVPTSGEWHHVVLTRTNATVELYLDNVKQTLTTTLNQGSVVGAIETTVPIYLGAGNSAGNPPSNFFSGSLDEFRMYDRVLTTQEVEDIYTPGTYVVSVAPAQTIPSEFRLYQNYPNPFNPETTVKFDVPRNEEIRAEIYDITGRFIRCLYDGTIPAGQQMLRWNGKDEAGRNVSTGVYFFKLQTSSTSLVQKMLLLK